VRIGEISIQRRLEIDHPRIDRMVERLDRVGARGDRLEGALELR
jgi:hypothetical protein